MAKVIIVFGILILIGLISFAYSHEDAHKQIYKNYGVDSTIHLFALPPYTSTEGKCPDSNCELAHSVNEIVGYQLLIIYFIISIGFLVVIAELEWLRILKEMELDIKNGK